MEDTCNPQASGRLTVPGLHNVGNTCFLNCILQALAAVAGLTRYLRQELCATVTEAPDLAVALLDCLEGLAPHQHAQPQPYFSPGPVMSAMREHVGADVLTDGEQNDAVEALEVLLGAIVSQLQDTFQHGRAPQLTTLSAWDAICAELDGSAACANPLTQLSAARFARKSASARDPDSQQGHRGETSTIAKNENQAEMQTPFDARRSLDCSANTSTLGEDASEKETSAVVIPQRFVSLRLSVANDGLTVTVKLSHNCLHSSAEAPSSNLTQECSQPASHASAQQSSRDSASGGDLMLRAWKDLSRLPLELALQHEMACARCRQPCASHVSAMLALPLTLPTAEGHWGSSLKPGTTLHHALDAYFARDLIQDAVCMRCSLRATLQRAPTLPATHSPCNSVRARENVSTASESAERGKVREDGNCVNAEPIDSRDGGGRKAAAEKLTRLRGLLRGSCAAPECDYAELAREAGLCWTEWRAPLLTRAVIARVPQVLCLQLRRVFWTRKGRLAKLSGRVSFPEVLDLAPYTAGRADPLLPVARPLVSHPLEILPRWQAHDQEHRSHLTLSESSEDADVGERSSKGTAIQQSLDPHSQSRTAAASMDGRQKKPKDTENDTLSDKHGAGASRRTEPGQDAPKLYRLASVVVHHGGAQSGHYTVFRRVPAEPCCLRAAATEYSVCKNVMDDFEKKDTAEGPSKNGIEMCRREDDACSRETQAAWVHASDEHVRTATLEEVLSCEAAVLLYERCLECNRN